MGRWSVEAVIWYLPMKLMSALDAKFLRMRSPTSYFHTFFVHILIMSNSNNKCCLTHVVISGSKTNSNFRRKTNLAGTSTVRVCNSASPRRTGWQIHNLQSRTAWKKKVAKASRVLAFEGMFIEQHTFLVIKSEITQLFIFLCISYITLKLLLAEGLLIWTQRLFVLWNGLMNGLIRAKSPPNDTRFVSKLLCYVAMKAQ